MDIDIERIRDTHLFKSLPERAFKRLHSIVSVRSFNKGQDILNLLEGDGLSKSFAYLISGKALFIGEETKPLGVAIEDEFFPCRVFSLDDKTVTRVVCVEPDTVIAFIPKTVFSSLAEASEHYSDIIEDVYENIYDLIV